MRCLVFSVGLEAAALHMRFRGQAETDIRDCDHWSFRSGRRVCPGMHLAEWTLSLAIVRILWAFKVGKEKGENGKRCGSSWMR